MKARVASVQMAPVFLDRDATIAKAVAICREAGKNGAQLVVFPETWVPAFPYWAAGFPSGHHGRAQLVEAYHLLWEQSVSLTPERNDLAPLLAVAKELGVYVVMGINEQDATRGRTLYNTNIYIDAEGCLAGKHRKLVPTLSERLVWGQGDGSTLTVVDAGFAKVGGLICYENTMPLARYALYAKGEQIHVANYPGFAASVDKVDLLARTIAFEGQVFAIVACGYFDLAQVPADFPARELLAGVRTAGGSGIVDPMGNYLAGPLVNQEGILYADLDMSTITRSKTVVDVIGHYARPDVFRLAVNERPQQPIDLIEG